MVIDAEYEEIDDADGEFDLSGDDSLPWLEADEDDEAAGGVDTVQVVAFALVLLTVLAGVVGAVWYFSNQGADAELIADGSTIAAPEGPIRERPQDPGGREFDGTGDVAPAVGEGEIREAVMATEEPPAPPVESPTPASTQAATSAPAPTGVGVQLAAYSSRARAVQGWNDLRRRTTLLNGLRYRIEQGVVDIGTVYRLQAVAADRASANALCANLKAEGLDCQVKP